MNLNSKNPTLSIHMCTYNRAHFVNKAIESVLSQTFTDFELLILDDCSTDNTEEIVKKYSEKDNRIKYIRNEKNLGITKNRNKALSLSLGKYIAVLDSDDYWIDNHKLEKQINFLEQNMDFVLVGTSIIIVNDKDKIIKKVHYPIHNFIIKKTLLIKNLFCHSSTVYRKKEILEIGSYDESLPIWEDYDLWLKLGTKYKLANIIDISTAYRIHNNQSNTEKIKIGQNTQAFIIEKYKKLYNGYYIAIIVNKLRNILK